jgi:hypothetical protein
MSVKGIHWAQEMRGVCPYKKALLYALGERHNKDTGICCPDQVMLANDAGMTDRTVRKYLKQLEDDGLITRKVSSNGRGLVTHYILHLDKRLPQSAGTNRKGVPDTKRKAVPVGPNGKGVPVAQADQPERERQPTGSCVPVHKDTNNHEVSSNEDVRGAFDKLWSIWPAKGRERSKAKVKVLDQFRLSAKKPGGMAVVDAARAWLRGKDPQYVPALDRWLRDGKFEHHLPKPVTAHDLQDRADTWAELNIWRAEWGPDPSQHGYTGPQPKDQGALL